LRAAVTAPGEGRDFDARTDAGAHADGIAGAARIAPPVRRAGAGCGWRGRWPGSGVVPNSRKIAADG